MPSTVEEIKTCNEAKLESKHHIYRIMTTTQKHNHVVTKHSTTKYQSLDTKQRVIEDVKRIVLTRVLQHKQSLLTNIDTRQICSICHSVLVLLPIKK